MTRTSGMSWSRATALGLGAVLALLPASAALADPVQIAIRNPGKTGLSPGRYLLELEPGGGAGNQVRVVLYPAPSGPRQRYLARALGCGGADLGSMAWKATVANRPDGSLSIQLASTSERPCRVALTIPTAPAPGIEGSPIGTAGAPPPGPPAPGIEGSPIGTVGAPKAPGIEGSPIGTAGAPQPPGPRGRRTGEADRAMEQVILEARQSLARVACPTAPPRVRTQLSRMVSALKEVAGAASPAAAVQPLRRFEAARAALQKVMMADPAWSEEAARCASAERTCAASGPAGVCAIESAVCLSNVLCAPDR